MLEFGDSVYYLDIKAFEKAVSAITTSNQSVLNIEEKETFDAAGNKEKFEIIRSISPNVKAIDSVRFDIFKTFIEYLVDYSDVDAEALGNSEKFFDEASLGYKIIFNTLLKEGILKEK